MMSKKSIEETISCPYDKSHQIYPSKMQTHLVKCRRNHLDAKKVPCMYNITHHIPEPELRYHYKNCPSRVAMDKDVYVAETTTNKYPIPQPVIQHAEVWDDEEVPAYDPQEHCKNNPILRNAVTFTQPAAVRRNFRMEERQRMQQFHSSEQPIPQQSSQPRRPAKESEGVVNRKDLSENDRLGVAQLLAKVQIGSNLVVTPKLNSAIDKNHKRDGTAVGHLATRNNNQEENGATGFEYPTNRNHETNEAASFLHDTREQFPALGEPNMNRAAVWRPANAMSRGRGRGNY